MGQLVRYFGVTAAGDGTGVDWDNRAALFAGGSLSTVITGHDFVTDALLCWIGPGAHSVSTGFSSTTWTGSARTAPSVAVPMHWWACDANGDPAAPPDPDWTSDQPAWDTTNLPVITVAANVSLSVSGWTHRLLNWTTTVRSSSSVVGAPTHADWCQYTNNASGANVQASNANITTNCVLKCGGTQYTAVCVATGNMALINCRLEGNPAAGSGNRYLLQRAGTTSPTLVERCTLINSPTWGIEVTSINGGYSIVVDRCVIANCASGGIKFASTTGQSVVQFVRRTILTANGPYGIDFQTNSLVLVEQCRLRDHSTANFTNENPHYPTGNNYNYTTDASDSDDYNDAANGDYRIKSTAGFANRGIGVSQMGGSSVQHFRSF